MSAAHISSFPRKRESSLIPYLDSRLRGNDGKVVCRPSLLPRDMRRRQAALYDAKQHKGFTLFELIIVIIIVSILGVVLLDRFWRYQEQAEKVAMEQLVGTLKSALNIQVAGLLAKGQVESLPQLSKENPINWLTEKPSNYLGEYFAPTAAQIQAGSWYFDLKDRELVYLPRRTEHFTAKQEARKWIRYKLDLVYNPERAPGEAPEVGGIVLRLTTPYTWF